MYKKFINKIKNNYLTQTLTIIIACIIIGTFIMVNISKKNNQFESVNLFKPFLESNCSIEKAIQKRRSIKGYKNIPLTLQEISQLLWSAQGITDQKEKLRTCPSPEALYPIEIYLVTENIKNLSKGIYKYKASEHKLIKISDKDKTNELYKHTLSQQSIKNAPASIIICAIYESITKKYGERGEKYAHLEAGCIAENIYLQAVSLDIGTIFIGSFEDKEIQQIINAEKNEYPLVIMPIGKI